MAMPGKTVIPVRRMSTEDFTLHIKHRHPMLQLLRGPALKRAHEQDHQRNSSGTHIHMQE
jgi:hypothetical protein